MFETQNSKITLVWTGPNGDVDIITAVKITTVQEEGKTYYRIWWDSSGGFRDEVREGGSVRVYQHGVLIAAHPTPAMGLDKPVLKGHW